MSKNAKIVWERFWINAENAFNNNGKEIYNAMFKAPTVIKARKEAKSC